MTIPTIMPTTSANKEGIHAYRRNQIHEQSFPSASRTGHQHQRHIAETPKAATFSPWRGRASLAFSDISCVFHCPDSKSPSPSHTSSQKEGA